MSVIFLAIAMLCSMLFNVLLVMNRIDIKGRLESLEKEAHDLSRKLSKVTRDRVRINQVARRRGKLIKQSHILEEELRGELAETKKRYEDAVTCLNMVLDEGLASV